MPQSKPLPLAFMAKANTGSNLRSTKYETCVVVKNNVVNNYSYDVTSALSAYKDSSADPATSSVNDNLGRPITQTFPDGSVESWDWDGPRLKSHTDRQGRKQNFSYDTAGRLADVYDGSGTNRLDHIDYDAASRITGWTTKDARNEYGPAFDMQGRPLATRQIRYKDSSGFGGQTDPRRLLADPRMERLRRADVLDDAGPYGRREQQPEPRLDDEGRSGLRPGRESDLHQANQRRNAGHPHGGPVPQRRTARLPDPDHELRGHLELHLRYDRARLRLRRRRYR